MYVTVGEPKNIMALPTMLGRKDKMKNVMETVTVLVV